MRTTEIDTRERLTKQTVALGNTTPHHTTQNQIQQHIYLYIQIHLAPPEPLLYGVLLSMTIPTLLYCMQGGGRTRALVWICWLVMRIPNCSQLLFISPAHQHHRARQKKTDYCTVSKIANAEQSRAKVQCIVAH